MKGMIAMAAAFNSGYGFGSSDSEIFGGFTFETKYSSSIEGEQPGADYPPVGRSYSAERAERLPMPEEPVRRPVPEERARRPRRTVPRIPEPEYDAFDDDFDQPGGDYDDLAFLTDDFDDDDAYPTPRRGGSRRRRVGVTPPRPYSESDSYFGRPMMPEDDEDERYYSSSRAPSWFEQMWKDGDRPFEDPRSSRNRVTSRAQRARMRVAAVSAGVLGAAAMVALIVGYFVYFRISEPLNVTTAFSTLTTASTYTLLKNTVDPELGGKTYTITIDDTNFDFELSDFEFGLAVPGVTEASSKKEVPDKDGNTAYQTVTCVDNFVFNETLVRDYLNRIAMEKGGSEMIEPYYEVRDDKLMVYAGTDGYGVEFSSFINELLSRIRSGSNQPIVSQMVTTRTEPVDIDKIYSEVACEAKDASYTTDETGQMIWIDEVVGKEFDLEAARAAISVGGTAWNIQLTLTQPDVHLAELRAPYCLDLLSSVTTEFSVSNTGRVKNIMQACEYLNMRGVIEPKGTYTEAEKDKYSFSYNETVGERTPARGFCKATVYTSEGTDEDYGGGICQVSSTLYYAAEKALMNITERWNHVYTVHYLPEGFDATVSWGAYDLKFENTRDYPIKINAYVKGGELTVEIWGTADGYTRDLKQVELSVTYPKSRYRHKVAGKKDQAGQMGKVVDTYRVTYFNGKEIGAREHAYESNYRALDYIYYVSSLPAGKTWDD